jgi:predicted HicB family RNase H-like nuclease
VKQRSKSESPFPLRMEHDLKSWLQVRARANKRSLNNEVLVALEHLRSIEQKREAQHG